MSIFQLQLTKILFKLIIIMKKKQKGVPFYKTPCIHVVPRALQDTIYFYCFQKQF